LALKVWPDSKEMTESFACYFSMIRHMKYKIEEDEECDEESAAVNDAENVGKEEEGENSSVADLSSPTKTQKEEDDVFLTPKQQSTPQLSTSATPTRASPTTTPSTTGRWSPFSSNAFKPVETSLSPSGKLSPSPLTAIAMALKKHGSEEEEEVEREHKEHKNAIVVVGKLQQRNVKIKLASQRTLETT